VSPSKVLDLGRLHRATVASPPRWLPHMELAALQSLVCIVVAALLGYAAPTVASPFRADRDGLPSIPSPVFGEEGGFILSWALLSSWVRRAYVGPRAAGAFLGVPYLIATSALRVHVRWASRAHLCSALSVSHALDGLLLAVPCRLVSSCCHVQVSRSRGFLPRPSQTTSSVARPSSPLVPPACHRLPDDASRLHVDLEVLIRVEIRSTRGVFSSGRYPRPLLRFAPSGFTRPVLEASLLPPTLGLWRPVLTVPRPLTCSAFRLISLTSYP